MPALLFHQNMRTFGGGSPGRVNAYAGIPPAPGALPATWPQLACPAHNSFGFPAIAARAAAAGAAFCAIGFTELTNEHGALDAAARLSQALTGGGHVQLYRFNCGVTAIGRREYATIAIPAGIAVLALGRVATGGPLSYVDDVCAPPFTPEAWSRLPEGASADYRFVVYAVLQIAAGPRFAVGFLHNTYTFESKIVTDLRMPFIVDQIWDNAVVTPQHVFIGGDFNVPPHRPNSRRPLYPHFIGTEANTTRPFQLIGGTIGGTTWGGNLYDYWLSDLPWGTPNVQAGLSTFTWDGPSGLMSDHVAIMLQIA